MLNHHRCSVPLYRTGQDCMGQPDRGPGRRIWLDTSGWEHLAPWPHGRKEALSDGRKAAFMHFGRVRRRSVRDDGDVEVTLPRRPDGRLDAEVGHAAANDDRLDTEVVEYRLERCVQKAVQSCLVDDDVAIEGGERIDDGVIPCATYH